MEKIYDDRLPSFVLPTAAISYETVAVFLKSKTQKQYMGEETTCNPEMCLCQFGAGFIGINFSTKQRISRLIRFLFIRITL